MNNTIPLDDICFEWCLGKPCGFITKKEKTVYWKTSAKGNQISKSFPISNYNDSIEKAELALENTVKNGVMNTVIQKIKLENSLTIFIGMITPKTIL